jgi:amino-acid N-acetyltransferase
MSSAVEIGRVREQDVPGLLALLENAGLPLDGVREHLETALVARDGTRVVGSAVLELYGEAVLLRSVAVAEALRGQGLGIRLTESALDLARARGCRRAFLLTETAGWFFPRFGFNVIRREQVPENVRASVEFATACPDSALVMEATL